MKLSIDLGNDTDLKDSGREVQKVKFWLVD